MSSRYVVASLFLATAFAASACSAPTLVRPIALPTARHGHRVERIDGGLLMFGGFGDAAGEDRGGRETWWLGPGAASWQRRADMATGRAFFSSAVVDGVVHAIGDGVERYDSSGDRWQRVVPPGTLPVSHFAAAAVGRTLYVLGGYPADRGGLHVVDLATGAVRSEPSPPGFKPGDHFHVMLALDGRLHVIGGLDVDTFQPRREHWVREDAAWKPQSPPPDGIWAKFAVQAIVDDRLYLFGDFGAWRFDPRSGAWTPRARLDDLLVMAPAVELGDTLWVLGGMLVERPGTRVLLAYDLAHDAWRDELGSP